MTTRFLWIGLACIILSTSAPAAADGSCSVTNNVIIGGGSIATVSGRSAADCCSLCNANPLCKAFTWDSEAQECFLKDNTDGPAQPHAQRTSGFRSAPFTIPRSCTTAAARALPFCDPELPIDARVRDLIARLHPDEKPPMLTARESPKGAVPRLDVAAYDWGANCIHGVQSRCVVDASGKTRCPTSFPDPNALGSAFNTSLVAGMGRVIGIELRALWLAYVGEANHGTPKIGLDCWSPNINVNRDPRWGRDMETPSEDPYILSQYGMAYTKGLQEGDDPRYLQAIVTLKHWVAYSLEDYGNSTRHNFNAVVSPYDLQDTYFPAWKASVESAHAKGVMCSYNALNGVPTCASSFLNNILRNEWGFDGYITSDSGAVKDVYENHHYTKTASEAACATIRDGGCDVDSGNVYMDALNLGVSEGHCNESDVDLALFHTLKLRFQLGLFDPIEDQPYWHVPPTAVNTPESQALNKLATRQSIILLKNEPVTLPFPKGKSIAVIGPHGNATKALVGNYLGWLCPGGTFDCITSPLAAISKDNEGGQTVFVQGCALDGDDKSGFAAAVDAARKADYVVYLGGIDGTVEAEGHDRTSIDLPQIQHDMIKELTQTGRPLAMVLINGGMLAIAEEKASVPAIVETFYPGFHGGSVISEVLFGDYNPGGKLPVTIYDKDYVNQVSMYDMSMTKAPGRSYKYYTGTPLYSFGHGLSYTQFKLESRNWTDGVRLSTESPSATFHIQVNVTNVGSRDGDEVVLAFFRPQKLPLLADNPLIKQLFGFERVHLKAGQSTTVNFSVSPSQLSLVKGGDRVISPGDYTLEFTNGVHESVTHRVALTGSERLVHKMTKMH